MEDATYNCTTNPSRTTIPGLDLGPYLAGAPGALEDLARSLREICENVGFFYIENHAIPADLIDQAFEASRRVHALPLENKREMKLNRDNIGYMLVNESMHRHTKVEVARKPNYNESFFCMRERGADHPDVVAQKPFRGMNLWPRDLPGFREVALAYQGAVEQLGRKMLPVVARALDLPADYFHAYFETPYLQLRMLHYPPRDASVPDQFGAGAHTDAGFFTFLMQRGIGGLQIRRKDGVWIDAPVMPGKYLINSGDMLHRWTNERFLSTPHRVMNVSATDRYSLACFFGPDLDKPLACLPTCRSPHNPPKYPPITYSDYKVGFTAANYFYAEPKT
ncbi:MAG: isopenicillin N synthase family oxygenase [Betaproteobacteria bacterium]|nr:isopenicillin N synthase family oxygenase [Betaproteobacteria bacterium]